MKKQKKQREVSPIQKTPTGIEGFDEIAHGGLPKERTTLVAGTTGAGKTIFATAFLYHGMANIKENAVFVTFEETPTDIMRNMKEFGWDLLQYERNGMLHFVDASTMPTLATEAGTYDLGALIARILHGIEKTNAKRVVIDTMSALFDRLQNKEAVRAGLFQLASHLKNAGVTTILTAEHEEGLLGVVKASFTEYVSDNVIVLHSYLENEFRKRTVEILKFRGTGYDSSATPLVINENGIFVFPRPHAISPETASLEKLSSGIVGLDTMLFGGFHKYSTTLVTGPSGTGKTTSAMSFLIDGAKKGEKGLYIAFEESTTQLLRNAESFGWPLKKYVDEGIIEIIARPPEERPAEEYYRYVKNIVERKSIKRFVLDSLSGLERIYSPEKFIEFVIGLNGFLKKSQVTSYLCNTSSMLLGSSQITESHLSTLTDNIVILKYVEVEGDMKRAISVLKTRGSQHEKSLHELHIKSEGVMVGDPFIGFSGIMGGTALRVVKPPIDVTEQTMQIDVLRKKFLEHAITQEEYFKEMKQIKENIHKIQEEGF